MKPLVPENSLSRANPARRGILPGLAALLAPALLKGGSPTGQTITVGALLSLTGSWSDLGTQCKLMLEIGAEDLQKQLRYYAGGDSPGVRFELLIEDTALDPQEAAQAAARLIQRGAQFIIGPQSSSEVREVKKITDAAGVVQVSPGSTAGTLSLPGDTVFRFVTDDSGESNAVAQVAAQEGIAAICPVWRADDGNRGLVNALRRHGPVSGIQVANGFEYPASGADFAQAASQLAGALTTLKATYPLSKIAVYLGAFDEGADLLTAASTYPDLAGVKWYAGDGAALSNLYLQPGPAQFAALTRFVAPGLALPAEARLLRDPIVQKTTAAGVPSPLAFAFAGYDAFACCTLAWLLAGGDKTKLSEVLPAVAQTYFGTTGWTILNANGDRALGNFEFFGIVSRQGEWEWKRLFEHQVKP